MAKKKTNALLESNPSALLPKLRPIVHFEPADLHAMTPHLIATGAVICASFVVAMVILLSYPSTTLQSLPPQERTENDLTFVRALSQLLPNAFAIETPGQEFPIFDHLASLQGHTVISSAISFQDRLTPKPSSISALTLRQLGMDNPWNAIK